MSRWGIAIALTCGLVIGAGCGSGSGGGDDESTASAGTIPKQEWIKRADDICKAANKKLQQDGSSVFKGQNPSSDDVEQFVQDSVIPTIEDEIDSISALPAPKGSERQADAILSAAGEGLGTLENNPQEIESGKPFAKANKLAESFGLTSCGS